MACRNAFRNLTMAELNASCHSLHWIKFAQTYNIAVSGSGWRNLSPAETTSSHGPRPFPGCWPSPTRRRWPCASPPGHVLHRPPTRRYRRPRRPPSHVLLILIPVHVTSLSAHIRAHGLISTACSALARSPLRPARLRARATEIECRLVAASLHHKQRLALHTPHCTIWWIIDDDEHLEFIHTTQAVD
jgi:hypothetical protein